MWRCIILLVIASMGCGADTPTISEPDIPALMDALMVPPTAEEVRQIVAEFDRLIYPCDDAGFEVIETREGQFAVLSLVAYESGGLRIYGVISRPKAEGTYPLLLYNHGGDSGLSANELDHPLAFGFVQVASAFRSEPVRWFGEQFVSEGRASPWDADVADALVMLSCAERLPNVDASRVLAFGGSRGGAVSLLAAIRAPGRFRSVVELFGPTDFFDPNFRDDLEALVNGTDDSRPGVGFLKTEILEPYINGGTTLDDARRALIRRSAIYFADRLPPVQIHHGTADEIVPISQSDRLAAQLEMINRPVEYFQYPGVGHDPQLGGQLLIRVLSFLGK
jgi:dipeptidyl aminopeptidase/acylaminoacyl peptidase